jgi:cobalt-zinc-cadmium efflux system outer membrane protein
MKKRIKGTLLAVLVCAFSGEAAAQEETVTLSELIAEVLDRNPGLESARQTVEARRFRISPARTLPEPALAFQTMGNVIPPTLMPGDPSSARTFGIEQEIPYPGKLRLKGKMAEQEAAAESWSYAQQKREVVAELKAAYFELYFVQQSIDVVRKNQSLLRDFATIAETRYRVGQGIQPDVLKAQVEVSRLLERLELLEEREGIVLAGINRLRSRPPETPVGRAVSLPRGELSQSLEELQRLASGYPLLKLDEVEIERDRYAVELARKEFYPDFGVGFTYFNRAAMPEMYGLMLSARVPLYFRRRQRPELQAATAMLASSQKKKESTLDWISFKLKDGYLKATTARRLVELYAGGIVPQARLSLESALAGYQVGRVDFLTLIDSQVTLLDYELKQHEVLADFHQALAELEPLVGIELTH